MLTGHFRIVGLLWGSLFVQPFWHLEFGGGS